MALKESNKDSKAMAFERGKAMALQEKHNFEGLRPSYLPPAVCNFPCLCSVTDVA